MSSQGSSNNSVSRDDIIDRDISEGQPIKVKFSLSGIMNSTNNSSSMNIGNSGIGIGGLGINSGIGGLRERMPFPTVSPADEEIQDASDPDVDADADADAADDNLVVRREQPPMTSLQYNDVDMGDDGEEDSMESASASASLTRHDAQDPDSNTETESNLKAGDGDEDMDVDVSITYDDKSQEDLKDHTTRTRATRSSSIDDQVLGGGGSGMANAAAEESMSNVSGGSTSKKKEDSTSQETEMTSRSAAAAAERELLGFREPAVSSTAPSTSFLDSLSEEQRRVRTRHLPDVSGFRRLHKAEIKRDLALVRKLLKGSSSSTKGLKKPDEDTEKDMEVDKTMGDGNGMSEDDSQDSADDELPAVRSKSGRWHMDDLDLNKVLENPDLPNIFSLPYTESPYICTDVEGKSTKSNPSLFSSPQVVESITAFNPPRPPESVGPKKIHRLNRWERRPQDVEVDLKNYRKTVDRTRQELHKAENENYKVEVVGQHLRAHFMSQSQLMRHEVELLDETYDSFRTQCVKSAELLTSKTRSRGTAKGANVMKDVLAVLKARKESGLESVGTENDAPWCSSGVGGISKKKSSPELASGWLLPGEKVSSPCGIGTVLHVFGPTILDVDKDLPTPLKKASRDPPQSQLTSPIKDKKAGAAIILSPRICVELPFGLGYFCPSELKSMENVAAYNDDQLSKRWMSMLAVSETMGSCIDAAAVDDYDTCRSAEPSSSSNRGDMTNSLILPDIMMTNAESSQNTNDVTGKLLPYGSSLVPSSSHRGGGLEDMSLEDLEENIGKMLDNSNGILGTVSFLSLVYC